MTVAEVKHLMRLTPRNKNLNKENRTNDAIQNNF
jgi:hypothetical protein